MDRPLPGVFIPVIVRLEALAAWLRISEITQGANWRAEENLQVALSSFRFIRQSAEPGVVRQRLLADVARP